MAIGFCVDYTVELMHFSSTAVAGARMADKMSSAVAACGYDVMHGCATAIVGCLVISFVPGEAFRMFGYLSMVMCAYGGMYALWCLPAAMILVESALHSCCCEQGAGAQTAPAAANQSAAAKAAAAATAAANANAAKAASMNAAIVASSASAAAYPAAELHEATHAKDKVHDGPRPLAWL
eukprot:CAMPEP_0115858550 /NCGR_PEP_ID=MMETSP0287-20121206/16157_1 /TAXON_ID=412157 /ORGANISM="Chrysochromulina rotalis, Strain UIO044" /LENGTH=179 /DNA_ID=CAMNT_0003312821 /DNA_START=9 /DNA_END=547 /DNA_ORIENTATION=-